MPLKRSYKRNKKLMRIKWIIEAKERLTEDNINNIFGLWGVMLPQLEKKKMSRLVKWLKIMRSGFLFRREPPNHIAVLVKRQRKGMVIIDKDNVLGEGSFGTVALGQLTTCEMDGHWSTEKSAIKFVDHVKLKENNYTPELIVDMIGDEVKAMTRCQHSNVIGLLFVIIYHDQTLLGMEFAGQGTLKSRLVHMTDTDCRITFTKILEAIDFCHTQGVVHLDIKPENILLDDAYNVKVADFGLSKVVGDPDALTENSFIIDKRCGTLPYMAPEMNYGETRDGIKCDIWSLGVLLYEMLAPGNYPFDCDDLENMHTHIQSIVAKGASDEEVKSYVQQVYDPNNIPFPYNFPKRAKRIACDIFTFDPIRRPAIHQVLDHSWLAEYSLAKPRLPNAIGKTGLQDRPVTKSVGIQCHRRRRRRRRKERQQHESISRRLINGVSNIGKKTWQTLRSLMPMLQYPVGKTHTV